MQEGDDEDLPPLEEDVDEGSRMEVSRIHARMIFLWACRQRGTRRHLCRLHPNPGLTRLAWFLH